MIVSGNRKDEELLTEVPPAICNAFAAVSERNGFRAETVRSMRLDIGALSRPLKRCDLFACGGTCCHDGVYLSSEEARVIRELVREQRDELAEIGAELPEQVVVYGKWRDVASGPKTATRPAPMREKVVGYPAHFPETRCVFLLPDSRCALQAFSIQEGRHPWHWKPLTCWLHPLSITTGPDRKPVLTLYGEETDPQRFEDYDGFTCRTHCGRTAGDGEAAWLVLKEELAALGEIGDRDLLREIEDLS